MAPIETCLGGELSGGVTIVNACFFITRPHAEPHPAVYILALVLFACECARQLRIIVVSLMADRGREILCPSWEYQRNDLPDPHRLILYHHPT